MPELTPEMQAVIDAAREHVKRLSFVGIPDQGIAKAVHALDRPKLIADQVMREYEENEAVPSIANVKWAADRGAALAIEHRILTDHNPLPAILTHRISARPEIRPVCLSSILMRMVNPPNHE